MSALTRLGEALRQFFVDPFEDGARQATDRRIIFIDPKELNDPDMAKNIAVLRASLERQFPGFSRGEADDLFEDFIKKAREKGPYAQKSEVNGAIVGVIVKPPPALDHISKIFHFETGIPLENMRRIPGDNYIWKKFLGIHEGEHINNEIITPPLDTDEKRRKAFQAEVDADRAGIKYLRELGHEDMIQAWKDYRALGGSFHATSVFLDDDGPVVVTQAHLDAARQFRDEMHEAVAQELRTDPIEAVYFFSHEPRKYIDALDRALERGEIGSTPEITAYIRGYAEAARRQVLEAHLDPAVPRGGNDKKDTPQVEKPGESSGHVHTHHSDAGSYTVIDDGPASGYFNAKAAGAPEEKPAPGTVSEPGNAPVTEPAALKV